MTTNTIDGHDLAQGMSFDDQHSTEIQPYGHLIPLPIGLSEPVCREGVEQLNQLLADTVTLREIKLLHTVVWLFFAGCIVAIPVAGARGHYLWAAVLTGLVLVECIVLMANRGRCPLTGVAARYTEQRTANFDIYLPLWLARHNKTIFGMLFVGGGLFVLGRWWMS